MNEHTGPFWRTRPSALPGRFQIHHLHNAAGERIGYIERFNGAGKWWTGTGWADTWQAARKAVEDRLTLEYSSTLYNVAYDRKPGPWWEGAAKIFIGYTDGSGGAEYTLLHGLYQHQDWGLDPRPAYFVMWAFSHGTTRTVTVRIRTW